MKITESTIEWGREDWLAGLVPNFSDSTAGNQKDMNGLAASRQMNPFRFLGGISPGFAQSDFTNVSVIDSVLRNGVVNGDKTYFVGGDNVQEITISTSTITSPVDNTIVAHGGHNTPVADDIVLYKIGTTLYAFYSWSDNADGDVGRFNLNATYDDDFMSTVPASGAVLDTINPHPLITGDDGIMYIGDGSNLHAFDGQTGANGTLSKNTFQLPKEYVITGMAKWNDFLAICAYNNPSGTPSANKGTAEVWIWDYSSEKATYVKNLNDWYVSDIFNYKGTLACWTQGRPSDLYLSSKTARLQMLSGEFEEIVAFNTNIPIRGGTEIVGDQILFNSGGTIYSYASPLKGVKAGLHKISEGSSGSSSGALKLLSAAMLLASTGTTTSGGCQNLSLSNYTSTNTQFSTCLASPAFPAGYIGEIERLRIEFFKNSTAGININIQIKDGHSNSSTISDNSTRVINTITSSNKVVEYINDVSGAVFFLFKDLKLSVSYGTGTNTDVPILEKVTVFYKPIKNNL